MDKARITDKMNEFQKKINYYFENIDNLKKAMRVVKIKPENRSKKCLEYTNSALATVGDAFLKAVLSDYFYSSKGIKSKGDLTDSKSILESNKTLHSLVMSEGWIYYAYNEYGFFGDENIEEHLKVKSTKHDPYVEAIIGAIYYDSNYETLKKWIIDILLPLLEKYE